MAEDQVRGTRIHLVAPNARRYVLLVPLLLLTGALRPPQHVSAGCQLEAALPPPAPAPSLYCIELLSTPDFDAAAGTVHLERFPNPFTVNVTAQGIHQYRFRFELTGLPQAGAHAVRPSTGVPPAGAPAVRPSVVYVAWLMTPMLDSIVKLGQVKNGVTLLGPAGLNKFVVFVSAERAATVTERSGRIVLRGPSPSTIMQPHGVDALPPQPVEEHHQQEAGGWFMPPMHPKAPRVVAGLERLMPPAEPYLPTVPPSDRPTDSLPVASPRTIVRLRTGDTLHLDAGLVRRTIGNRSFVMYAFNRQYPGPLLEVDQGSEVVVDFHNHLDQPTSIHWHGLRLDNRFDGVPGLTQEAVPPGGTFVYHVRFPDAGIYWYHPHIRADIQQDLGLYGNMLVAPTNRGRHAVVNQEEVLMLDDLLIGSEGLLPWGRERATHAFMGRFGNVFLVNGEPDWHMTARAGEVVRFYFTNASNTRTWNVSIPGVRLKLVGADASRYEQEEWVESIPIAPAERYVVEARFESPGRYALVNQIQGIDHVNGVFFAEVDTLGVIDAVRRSGGPAVGDSARFYRLQGDAGVRAGIAQLRSFFDRPPDHTLLLTLKVRDLPFGLIQTMRLDTGYVNPVEWAGSMPMMDWLSTAGPVEWVLRDVATGRENMDIGWHHRVGEIVKLRLVNDRHTLHPMAHPIHLHGQRFLVLAVNGVPNDNLAWKDTALVPAGGSLDLLVEFSNPGKWMLHCHIAEHLEAGMHTVIDVD